MLIGSLNYKQADMIPKEWVQYLGHSYTPISRKKFTVSNFTGYKFGRQL